MRLVISGISIHGSRIVLSFANKRNPEVFSIDERPEKDSVKAGAFLRA
jgi:hypothetical protein